MVRIKGRLGPFRITRDQFIELVTQLDRKMSAHTKQAKEITVTLDRFSEACSSIKDFAAFLRDIQLPTVVRQISLSLSSGNYYLTLLCDTGYAEYSIDGAADVTGARSIETILLDFRNSHGAPRFMNSFWAYFIAILLGVIGTFDLELLLLGHLIVPAWPLTLGGRVVIVSIGVCVLTLLGYIVWSFVAKEPPPFSFYHSLLYMRKEPKNSSFWILVFTLVVEAVMGSITSLLLR